MSIEVTDEMIYAAQAGAMTLCHTEPDGEITRAMIAAVVPLILEECAKAALAQRVEGDSRPSWNAACASVYAAIRALASRPVSEREGE